MPARKPDLSRLVMLTMTPTEAAILQGLLLKLQSQIADMPEACETVLHGTLSSLDLQLRHLKWPERNKAPYPV